VRHVAILGPPGAGKSRLARELSRELDLPVVHLDQLYWKPGWVPAAPSEWDSIQRRERERDSWIAEGLQEERGLPSAWLDEADTVVLLDVSPVVCIWRIVKRRLDSTPGPDTPEGCEPAPLYRAFPKVLRYLWLYRSTVRPRVLAELARRGGSQQVAVLRSDDDVRAFLATAKAQHAALGESLLA
jgi:adenylate kinase family enzyme